MKKRKSKAYLIISSAHLGVDEKILQTLSHAAEYYKAQVIHLGQLLPEKELRRYENLTAQLDRCNSEAREERVSSEMQFIEDNQTVMLSMLQEYFGNMTFVLTKAGHVPLKPSMKKGVKINYGDLHLSRLLQLSPIQPTGDRSVMNQMTGVSVRPLKMAGRNWIAPHPVPHVGTQARRGLNQTFNYWTVGALRNPDYPTKTNEQYRASHMPAAVMVLIDVDNDEFHAKHLHIDYTKDDDMEPMILDDGLVFKTDGYKEAKSADRLMFITDAHAPHTHLGTVGAFRTVAQLFEPETIVDGGDAADFESISPHTLEKPGEREGLRVVNDIQNLKSYLSAISTYTTNFVKKKILLDSNHHDWLSQLVSANPSLEGLLDWGTLAEKEFSDWVVFLRHAGENVVFEFGDFTLRHGDREGLKKGEAMTPWGKYLCGHHHTYQTFKRAVQIGCAAKLGPAYVRNQIDSWQSQIATLTKSDDVAAVNPKIVLHDKEKAVSRVAYRNVICEMNHHNLIWRKS